MATVEPSYQHAPDARELARRLWQSLEVVHTPVYFSSDVADACRTIGLRDRMMGYTAMRTAPLGVLPAEVVTAVLYGFSPRLVAYGVRAAWEATTPDAALEMTQAAATGLLTDLFAGLETEVARAAELAREVALLHPILGRPLGAAWSSVAWGDDPALVLWQAATRIRESRGDGHLAQLVAADLDGVGSHLTLAGDSQKLRERYSGMRGWTDPEWDAGVARLRDRGFLDDDGGLTDAGTALREHIEQATDDVSAAPWQLLGVDAAEQLDASLRPLVERVAAAQIVPRLVTRRVLGDAHPERR